MVGPSTGRLLTSLVILLLVVLWGAVFLPAILRARQDTSPIATVGSFRRGMRALSGGRTTSGRWVLVPKTPRDAFEKNQRAVLQRRRVFEGLVVASAATLLLGLFPILRFLLVLHLIVDVVLASFVLLLRRLKGSKPPKHAFRHGAEMRERDDIPDHDEIREALGAGSL